MNSSRQVTLGDLTVAALLAIVVGFGASNLGVLSGGEVSREVARRAVDSAYVEGYQSGWMECERALAPPQEFSTTNEKR